MRALTFNRTLDCYRWIGQQVDGEPVGSIRDYGDGFLVGMIDTRGGLVCIGTRRTLPAAQRMLVKAWQLQLSKGGNP